jgi:hypothetical protein
MTTTDDFIQYAFLSTESGLVLAELNIQLSTFRKIVSDSDIMEVKTRPKYNEFLKEWSQKNKITSFFGSDKPEFLQAWNNVKTAGVKKPEPVVAAPKPEPIVVAAPVMEDDEEDDSDFDEDDREEFGGVDIKSLERQLREYYEPGMKKVNSFIDMVKKNGNKNPYYEKGIQDGEYNFDIDLPKGRPISNGPLTFILKQRAYYNGVIRDIKKRIKQLS